MSNQHELDSPPSDAISSARFSSGSNKLLVSSWDRTVSVYHRYSDPSKPFALERRIQCRAPVLDVCWGAEDSVAYAVGLDYDVRRLYLASDDDGSGQTVLSTHESASNKVAFNAEHGILLSTSWDGTLHVHNIVDADGRSFIRIALAAKPFSLSLTSERAVVAMAERMVSIYDLRALKMLSEQMQSTKSSPEDEGAQAVHATPWQQRESSLKFMTRAAATMPDGTGFATSSIEGRVGVEWFDPEKQGKAYAFKCHRQTTTAVGEDGTEKEVDMVHPVNALAFHPVYGTFATGGGDGVVAVWDAETKRRIRQYQKLTASIAALDFSPDGKWLAIGVSPGFEDGQEDVEVDGSLVKIIIRELGENEVRGKGSK